MSDVTLYITTQEACDPSFPIKTKTVLSDCPTLKKIDLVKVN